MPELPEVETIVQDLRPYLRGKRLVDPKLTKTNVLRGVTARRLLATLRQASITDVTRRAKHAVFLLSTGDRMVIQPRMTGNLIVYARPLSADEKRYAVLSARVGRRTFVYRDVRRLGTISLLDEAQWSTYTAAIGPEPLADGFDRHRFAERFQSSRTAIKKALMDQRRLAGVGNIYANEALFRAGIDPSCPANHLGPDDYARLHRAVRHVLRQAVRARGTTVRDYRSGRGDPGRYQRTLLVYGRGGHPCRRCGTQLTTTHAIDGRATTFCWRCQGCGRAGEL